MNVGQRVCLSLMGPCKLHAVLWVNVPRTINCIPLITEDYIASLACSSQCWYFAVASNECYASRLPMMVTCVDGRACCNFHGTVQCCGQMLHSNFLHLVSLSGTDAMHFAMVLH